MKIFQNLTLTFILIVFLLYIIDTDDKKICKFNIWHTPKRIIYNRSDINQGSQQLIDHFSLTHISHGIILYYIINGYLYRKKDTNIILYILLTELCYEIIGNTEFIINRFRKTERSKDYSGDSLINIIGDIYFCLIGIMISWYFDTIYGVLYVLASEIWLKIVINSNMTYNILQIFGLVK